MAYQEQPCRECAELRAEIKLLTEALAVAQAAIMGRNVHADGPSSEREAAASVRKSVTKTHWDVIRSLADAGRPLSARQLERLDRFSRLSPSTVRKRVSELWRMGYVRQVGEERDSGTCSSMTYELTDLADLACKNEEENP